MKGLSVLLTIIGIVLVITKYSGKIISFLSKFPMLRQSGVKLAMNIPGVREKMISNLFQK
ncbi:formate-dependent nitrite reductase membrane component NrfD [Gracilibacillus halotolerans]|uniref:Formate-dependent nitrite reductase membrane component NrfD n=1 Tax=Gracilibacillus halotolerans TaxID=74386 RepID=A0A841RH33_9BACI|nr:hypothetical protein [Gracilibacillus halotolerans]MBB6511789.1 formate-dependent nitrite reductase membrane component NrfD [Gracilibacillus halotolerans]